MPQRFLSPMITIAFAIGLMTACSGHDNSINGAGPAIRTLNQSEKVEALEAYLPWLQMRDALEIVAEPDRDSQASPEILAIVEELRDNCIVRKSADALPALDKLSRASTLEITAGADRENCPIDYKWSFVFARATNPDGSLVKGRLNISYKALTARAKQWAPIKDWRLRGSVTRKTDALEQGEILHDQKESLIGSISSVRYGPLEVRVMTESETRFRGSESKKQEREQREIKLPLYWAEWSREREFADGQMIQERHYINKEELSPREMDKLQKDAKNPRPN